MTDMVPAGIAIAACAGVAFEVAYVLQALEARVAPSQARPAGALAGLLRRRRWLAGLALSAVGAILQVVALRLAPLTVVQPTLAIGIVALVGVGGKVLGEPAGRADLVAALALAGGIAVLGIAGSHLSEAPPSGIGTAIVLVVLGAPVAAALILRGAPALLLLGAAGTGDAAGAIAAKRFADAWGTAPAPEVVGWFVLGAAAIGGALASEMAALRTWPATRVGPFVVACQTAIPVLLAPIVAGERWGSETPFVLIGLAVVVGGAWRLAVSAGLIEQTAEVLEDDVGGGRQAVP